MKKLMRGALIIGMVWMLTVPLYAKASSSNKIFPTYTGISALITGKSVNIRAYPDQYSQILQRVSNTRIYVVGQNNDWYKIMIGGEEGWVYKTLVEVSRPELVPYSKILGEEIVDYGKQFIGTPYVWGGNDLKRGVDCSGLTKEVYETFDIDLSRVSYMQANEGRKVKKEELKPGDLVFFDTSGVNNGNVSHVGIYVGDNQFLHADSTKGVMVSNLNSSYYKRNYVISTRIIGI